MLKLVEREDCAGARRHHPPCSRGLPENTGATGTARRGTCRDQVNARPSAPGQGPRCRLLTSRSMPKFSYAAHRLAQLGYENVAVYPAASR